MITNLSANREIQDFEIEDAFDFKIKADAITSFLEYNVQSLLQNKMLALFGNWGSGKTSLMRHIEKSINKDIYYPIFFEAWSHEKDENLALSLCDLFTDELADKNNVAISEFYRSAVKIFKGFTSAISVKVGGPWTLSEISMDGGRLVENLNTREFGSSFEEDKNFKNNFLRIESALLSQKRATRILVFVDDLDRCEPENVLNLITALKLFFTYGQHTIFFAALDKEAVTKAVRTKYQDVVKSEEYLEKVFDISFGMPRTFSLTKYLLNFFKSSDLNDGNETSNNLLLIDDFFHSIGFTTPRHVKKILNKYQILSSFKDNEEISVEIRGYVPKLLFRTEKGNVWETIFCLFFIVLYENFPLQFDQVENYDVKLKNYLAIFYNDAIRSTPNYAYSSASNSMLRIELNKNISLNSLFTSVEDNKFSNFVLLFADPDPAKIKIFDDETISGFGNYFTDNGILTRFCLFLIRHKETIGNASFSEYLLWDYFRMAKYLL